MVRPLIKSEKVQEDDNDDYVTDLMLNRNVKNDEGYCRSPQKHIEENFKKKLPVWILN